MSLLFRRLRPCSRRRAPGPRNWASALAVVAAIALLVGQTAPGRAESGSAAERALWPPLTVDPTIVQPVPPTSLQLRENAGTCFVAGFTGWRPPTTGTAPFAHVTDPETAQDARVINAESPLNRLLTAAEQRLDGDRPHLYRFYEWQSNALPEIEAAARSGRKIVIVGHGPGGSSALTVAQFLALQSLPVTLLMEIDTFDGAARGLGTDASDSLARLTADPAFAPAWASFNAGKVPANVLRALNYYQTTAPQYHGRAQSADDGAAISLNRELDGSGPGLDELVAAMPDVAQMIAAACLPPPPPPEPFFPCGGIALDPRCDFTPGLFP